MAENMTTIEIEITDEEFITLAKMAHEQDITFNQLVSKLLKEYMDNHELHQTECYECDCPQHDDDEPIAVCDCKCPDKET